MNYPPPPNIFLPLSLSDINLLLDIRSICKRIEVNVHNSTDEFNFKRTIAFCWFGIRDDPHCLYFFPSLCHLKYLPMHLVLGRDSIKPGRLVYYILQVPSELIFMLFWALLIVLRSFNVRKIAFSPLRVAKYTLNYNL